jgi:hypothetical protein
LHSNSHPYIPNRDGFVTTIMSFGGGFGGFGQNNNTTTTQSTGFGGFGATNNNNNTSGKIPFFNHQDSG